MLWPMTEMWVSPGFSRMHSSSSLASRLPQLSMPSNVCKAQNEAKLAGHTDKGSQISGPQQVANEVSNEKAPLHYFT